MGNYNTVILLLVLCAASIATLSRWRLLSSADRWIPVLVSAAFFQECIAAYLTRVKMNNYPSYHIYTPIEVAIICMYFDRSMRFRSKYLMGGVIALISVCLSVFITVNFQPLTTYNSYFLLYEGCLVIVFCLLSFYKLLIRDDVIPVRMAHFWLTICFLLYWSILFANLGLFARIPSEQAILRQILIWTLYCANLLFYLALALIALRYKKLIPSGA